MMTTVIKLQLKLMNLKLLIISLISISWVMKNSDLKILREKLYMIVNTASKCVFLSQYAALEKLYQEYKDKSLVIIGVPCNDFANQEPGTNQEVAIFCKLNNGINFHITQKEKVLREKANSLYKWAKETLGLGTAQKWNFHKYLINREGKPIDYFFSTTTPQSKVIRKAIEAALNDNFKSI